MVFDVHTFVIGRTETFQAKCDLKMIVDEKN